MLDPMLEIFDSVIGGSINTDSSDSDMTLGHSKNNFICSLSYPRVTKWRRWSRNWKRKWHQLRHARGAGALWSGTNKNRDVSTRPLARPFARTAHSLACSRLLASLAPFAALTRSLARLLRSLPCLWESELLMSQNDLVFSHSALV